jgi:damage-control phosphatase, subfamily III
MPPDSKYRQLTLRFTRRVQLLFSTSSHWKGYDIFKRSKDSAFAHSRAAVEELAGRYMQVVSSGFASNETSGDNARLLFEEMTQIALWGNATDLSLLTKLSLDEIQSLQGARAIEENRQKIISNDTERVWQYLSGSAPQDRIDIVLDNAGFEFFTDLVYASYLLKSGLTRRIIIHTKDFPWFVSDVTPYDVEIVLSDLENSKLFPGRQALDLLVQLLRSHFSSGELSVQHHPFWTTASPFQDLPAQAPDLYSDLQKSALVIFKGDLNYRKLTSDRSWPYTTPFKTALGPIGQNSGLKILALRTNKADVCVGVPDQETVKRLDEEAPGLAWIRNGKYAVVSFCDGV